jgi:Cu/Ag efflux protein CusF
LQEIELRPCFFAAALLGAALSHAASPEWVPARVVKVDPERSRITLDHQPIRSIDMPAMVMPFKVDPALDLRRFKPGDKVRFTVTNKDDHLSVSALEAAR